MATQIGTDLIIGVGQTMGSYVVEEVETDGDDIENEDIDDEDGALKTRIILKSHDKITLTLRPLSGAAPSTDFVKGVICAVAPLSDYYIEDKSYNRVKGAARVRVTGVNIGIT